MRRLRIRNPLTPFGALCLMYGVAIALVFVAIALVFVAIARLAFNR